MSNPCALANASLASETALSRLGFCKDLTGSRSAVKSTPDTFRRLGNQIRLLKAMNAWEKKRRLMRRYDQSSRAYDNQYRDEQEAKIQAALDSMRLTSESVILDVGCGTGLLLEHIANKSQLILATDISRGLLSMAKKKAKSYQSATLVQSDSDNLPFRNETFHIVFAVTVMQNVPDPEVTLSEIRRVSKPNAKILVTGLKKSFTKKKFIDILEEAHLKIKSIKANGNLMDYVCVCSKAPVKSKWRTQ